MEEKIKKFREYLDYIERHYLNVQKAWKLINNNWQSDNFGFAEDKPKWLSFWLLIIVDNTWHILINTLTIFYYLK